MVLVSLCLVIPALTNSADLVSRDECAIAGIGIDTSYDQIISAIGPPKEEKDYRVSTASSDRPKKTLIYDGLYIALFKKRVKLVKATGPGYPLPSGISVGSHESEVLDAYGIAPRSIDESRSSLTLTCLAPGETNSGLLLQMLIVNGIVDNLVVSKSW